MADRRQTYEEVKSFFGVMTLFRAQEKNSKYIFRVFMVPGFVLAIDIMKANLKPHFLELSLIKPWNHVKKNFSRQKF